MPSVDTYVEYPPGPALEPYVECFWTRSPSANAPGAHRVLPDGCLDIVFCVGHARARRVDDSAPRRSLPAAVVGTMTRPLFVEAGPEADFIGVRFRPGQARTFLRTPANEFTDDAAALGDVWDGRGHELESRLFETPDPAQRLRLLEAELRRQLMDAAPGDARIEAAVRTVLQRRGAVSVRELSATCNLTRQHLAHKFQEFVGVPPKLFCRVVRFQALLRRLQRQKPAPWAALAADLGYYDQAHLIADFRRFTGLSPARFLQRH